MPDLEERITETLDRLGERPDPSRILAEVGRRKRRMRATRRFEMAALVVVVLTGLAGGTYGLSRAFGFGTPAPNPIGSVVQPSLTNVPSPPASPGVRPTPSAPASPATPTPSPSASAATAIARCSDQTSTVAIASQQGAAGTIMTVWKVTNTASAACRSFAYPGMDFRGPNGWLNVQVHRGGFPNIDRSPTSIVVPAGGSLYFVSYWGDATTSAGACTTFDRVKVTLPDNFVSAEVAATGCVDPGSVDVGPVVRTPPA